MNPDEVEEEGGKAGRGNGFRQKKARGGRGKGDPV